LLQIIEEVPFTTPKPVRLITRILQLATDKDSLILDSFAGSGTTGHAVLSLNKADGGKRRFILVEMDEGICQDVTAQRLRRVIDGYESPAVARERDANRVPGLGGGFRFCKLADPLFDDAGNIAGAVCFPELAAHVYFTQSGQPLPKRTNGRTPLLGVHNGTAIYLLYNGILGDKRPDGGNVLTSAVLAALPPHDGPRIVYGEGCRLGRERLKRESIVFKQIPYEIKVG